jgi:DNA-binding transcriptional LysR family regulator
LAARRVGAVLLGLFPRRAYAERYGLPATLGELTRHHIVGFDRNDHSARAVASGTLPISRDLFATRVDSDVAQVMAVRAGLGIGMMQKIFAAGGASLVPVLPDAVTIDLDCWLVVHDEQKDAAPIRVVLDGLAHSLMRWIG